MLLNDFYDKKRIESEFGLPVHIVNNLIRTNKFPKPDEVEGKTLYWHRITLQHFFAVYNKIQASKSKYNLDYERQRDKHLDKARSFIKKFNINSPFEYREIQAERGVSFAPTPSTLFCYSITFEELVSSFLVTDKIAINIINNLNKKRTTKELAFLNGVSERTIHRKIALLREAGYDIKSDSSGVWI